MPAAYTPYNKEMKYVYIKCMCAPINDLAVVSSYYLKLPSFIIIDILRTI